MAKVEGRIAKRYAKALFELTQPAQLEARRDALLLLAQVIEQNPRLSQILQNPALAPATREKLLREVFDVIQPGDEVCANFLVTVLNNGRLPALQETAKIFGEMISTFMRMFALKITSAFPLSSTERESLQSAVRAQIPADYAALISVEWAEDKSLLGGMVVKAGDKILDGSLAGSLARVARSVQHTS